MSFTIITHFNAEGYRKLNAALSAIADEKVCRVPYGRVADSQRHESDTLPYHLTVTSTKMPLRQLTPALDGLTNKTFNIRITGLGVMPGKKNSRVLYFMVAPSPEMDSLQERMYDLIGNDRYLPGRNTLHITVCISKDTGKIKRIYDKIMAVFTPFTLTVMALGLYEIWPGRLMAEYHFTEWNNGSDTDKIVGDEK